MNSTFYAISLFVFIVLGITSTFAAFLAFVSGAGAFTLLSWVGIAAFSFLVLYVIELSERVAVLEARLNEEEEE
ncbi:hypothetical protein JCM19046_4595 [Bacillus sp. JCM 19046]|nr:hypothetical protein JCM19045_3119 [Bacillus sp. JCM 19045]GAF19903.1 hypothetical protein JCM19046_4595 [Bacillus sp. JCM 19046]